MKVSYQRCVMQQYPYMKLDGTIKFVFFAQRNLLQHWWLLSFQFPAGPVMNILNGSCWACRLCSVIIQNACDCSGFNVHLCIMFSMSIIGAMSTTVGLKLNWWTQGGQWVVGSLLFRKYLPSLTVASMFKGSGALVLFDTDTFCFHRSCRWSYSDFKVLSKSAEWTNSVWTEVLSTSLYWGSEDSTSKRPASSACVMQSRVFKFIKTSSVWITSVYRFQMLQNFSLVHIFEKIHQCWNWYLWSQVLLDVGTSIDVQRNVDHDYPCVHVVVAYCPLVSLNSFGQWELNL